VNSALTTGDWPGEEKRHYESHYAIGQTEHTSNDGANLGRFIVYLPIRLLGEPTVRRSGCSAADMLSSEEASVDGPGTWPNHRQRAAEDREHH
jgi:hypothetical protein